MAFRGRGKGSYDRCASKNPDGSRAKREKKKRMHQKQHGAGRGGAPQTSPVASPNR